MWWKFILIFCATTIGIYGNLRQNSDLHTFNAGKNEEVRDTLIGNTVIITLRLRDTNHKPKDEEVLFGFDIFALASQNFTVSADYKRKLVKFEVSTAVGLYYFDFDISAMEKNETINTLYLRFDDEGNTVYTQVNCAVQGSIVAPLNLVGFFRSINAMKYKVLFNKHYEVEVYSDTDQVDENFLHRCESKTAENPEEELIKSANILARFASDDANMINNVTVNSNLLADIFVQTFLIKQSRRENNPLYKTIRLIRSVMHKLGPVFEAELERIVYRMLTGSITPYYMRYGKENYYENSVVKQNLLDILFEDNLNIPAQYLRGQWMVGELFRRVFLNPKWGINKLFGNDSHVKNILHRILFLRKLEEDEQKYLRNWHTSKELFVRKYLKDVNHGNHILIGLYKLIILHASHKDYRVIGSFIRKIFFKPSGMMHSGMFIENDVEIGKRMVVLGALGKLRGDLYRTIRMVIIKKEVELPVALENDRSVIQNSLQQALGKKSVIISNLEWVLKDIIIYNDPKPGQIIDKIHGNYIYDLYKTLIMNDLKREPSLVKTMLVANSKLLHSAMSAIISAVVDNVDKDKTFRSIAVDYAKDVIVESGENLDLARESDFVKLFQLIFAKQNNTHPDNQKILNVESLLIIARAKGAKHSSVVNEVLAMSNLSISEAQTKNLIDIVANHKGPNSEFVQKVDLLLRKPHNNLTKSEEKVNKPDRIERLIFYEDTFEKADKMIFGLIELPLQAFASLKLLELKPTIAKIKTLAYPGFLKFPFNHIGTNSTISREDIKAAGIEILKKFNDTHEAIKQNFSKVFPFVEINKNQTGKYYHTLLHAHKIFERLNKKVDKISQQIDKSADAALQDTNAVGELTTIAQEDKFTAQVSNSPTESNGLTQAPDSPSSVSNEIDTEASPNDSSLSSEPQAVQNSEASNSTQVENSSQASPQESPTLSPSAPQNTQAVENSEGNSSPDVFVESKPENDQRNSDFPPDISTEKNIKNGSEASSYVSNTTPKPALQQTEAVQNSEAKNLSKDEIGSEQIEVQQKQDTPTEKSIEMDVEALPQESITMAEPALQNTQAVLTDEAQNLTNVAVESKQIDDQQKQDFQPEKSIENGSESSPQAKTTTVEPASQNAQTVQNSAAENLSNQYSDQQNVGTTTEKAVEKILENATEPSLEVITALSVTEPQNPQNVQDSEAKDVVSK